MGNPSTKPPPADPDTPVLARYGLAPELERRLLRVGSEDVSTPVTVGELRRLFGLPRWLDNVLARQLAVDAVRDALVGEGGLVRDFEAKLEGLPDDAPAPIPTSELRPFVGLMRVLIARLAKVR
ncbi:MAG TPA: hypothetical protein VJT73_17655 [Polyangiaceae bacterium]|nr:hypothetical protein [Polyangiaceae bacterium]